MKYSMEDVIKSDVDELETINVKLGINWISYRLQWLIANFTNISPNQISTMGFVFILISAYFFLKNHFILGAIFFELRWICDVIDGRLARLKKMTSKFGAFWDNYPGLVGVAICMLAISYRMDFKFLIVAFLILFLRNLHTYESMKVMLLIGKPAKKENKGKGIVNRISATFNKLGLEEPFNMADNDQLLFVAFPVISVFVGHLFEMWLVLMIIMLLKALFFFWFYSGILINSDKK